MGSPVCQVSKQDVVSSTVPWKGSRMELLATRNKIELVKQALRVMVPPGAHMMQCPPQEVGIVPVVWAGCHLIQ